MEKTGALIETLKIYAETDQQVTQHFYQGLCLSVKERLDELEHKNVKLRKAIQAWQKYDSEAADKHPCPDYTLRIHYRKEARKLTKQVLKGQPNDTS